MGCIRACEPDPQIFFFTCGGLVKVPAGFEVPDCFESRIDPQPIDRWK
jgi:hypothetical protein